MGFISQLQQKPEKTKARIAFVFALLLAACIAVLGILFYTNPYEVDTRASSMNPIEDFPEIFSDAKDSANSFVEPISSQFQTQ